MSAATPPPTIITHGCRSNLAERDALQALAPAGSTVINSCAVTAEAVRDARAAVRAAAANGPVFITGCAATLDPKRFSDLAQVIANDRKFLRQSWGAESDAEGAAPALVTRQSRGFVAVQDGCDHDCTFCVTRLARGRSRSVAIEAVVAEVAGLVEQGVKEVVLTGIDTTSYGLDLASQPKLGQLVQAILAQTQIARLRLSSLDAAEADEYLLEAYQDKRLMPYVHLSLQSGDDLILKRMKRRHSRQEAINLTDRLQQIRPDIAIGADLIAGFPTESEAAHQNSLSLIKACNLLHTHIFPFPARPQTAAARMPQLPAEIRKSRASALREAAATHRDFYLIKQLYRDIEVVSEGLTGLSPQGFRLNFTIKRPKGALFTLSPTSIRNGVLCE